MTTKVSPIHHGFFFICSALLIALAAPGCGVSLGEGQYLCDPEVPGSCPPGFICQARGTSGESRCYSEGGDYCGNGVKDADEACDGTDFGEQTCESLFQRPGLIVCRENCSVHCTECGNGLIEMIDDDNGEECDDGNNDNEDGCSSNCLLERCGDRVVQSHEACDFGDNVDGDGCSANCLSNESCGNHYLDVTTGEQCDDGNRRSNDGCASGCTFELASWTRWTSRFETSRGGHSMVLDSDRNRIVLFGGRNETGIINETWEYDGQQWNVVSTPVSPPARQYHAMAYDSARQRMVMFGGTNTTGLFLADTWEFDGSTWQQISTPTAPSPRRDAKLAYDALRGRLVLFGGQSAALISLGDTWEYDGTSWQQITPVGPSPLIQNTHSLVYDTAQQRVLLAGDDTTSELVVWAYDGTAWSELTVVGPAPSRRFHASVAFDSDRGVLVLHGGRDEDEARLTDTWEFDGSAWQQPSITVTPPGRTRAPMVYFPTRQRMILQGGYTLSTALADTWEYAWNSSAANRWTELDNAVKPPSREAHAMAYDSARGLTVVWGGQSDGVVVPPSTWEFNGQRWTVNSGVTQTPSARTFAQMVYDSAREVLVLFGGRDFDAAGFPTDHTWEYDGIDWTPINTATVPPSRILHAMAYDPGEGVVVMYGGNEAGLSFFDDTWVYDGVDWTQRAPASPPTARGLHQMAYSPVLQRIVLFGGIHLFERHTDTWLYDTAQDSWIQLTTPTSPSFRALFGMAWDESRHKLLLYGGFDTLTISNDTWEFDGFSWRQQHPASSPLDQMLPSMVYDILRKQPVIFGGYSDETWTYDIGAPATEQCDNSTDDDADGLVSCDDPDCATAPNCESLHTVCVNPDGTARCEDARCGGYPCRTGGVGQHLGKVCMAGACVCPHFGFEADCTNGQDDNCDGIVDCQDTAECGDVSACQTQEASCLDGFDNDGDWLIDCADDDCIVDPRCESPVEQSCTDGIDNDGDGRIDCLDGDCAFDPDCPIEPFW